MYLALLTIDLNLRTTKPALSPAPDSKDARSYLNEVKREKVY
jgi:hypothetical protein